MQTTVSYTTASGQDGTYVGGGFDATQTSVGVFSGAPFPSQIGLVFDYGLSFDAGNRPLDPPILVSFQVQLTTASSVVADPGTEILELYAVPAAAPANYSNTL